MSLTFEPVATRYAIPISDAQMLALMDSESYVTNSAAFDTGNETLSAKLRKLPINDAAYNGHFGSAVYAEIEKEDDTAENHAKIIAAIEEHLAWCQTLEVVPHVAERRKAEAGL